MNLTFRQLEVFCAIARQGNVSRAAEDAGLTQSAASMALGELERQLGELLFDRMGRRIILNGNGKRLLPIATELLARAEELEQEFSAEDRALRGELVIGASSTIGNYLMPRLIAGFCAEHPEVKVRLKVANTKQIITDALNFELDIGFVEGSCNQPEIDVSIWREESLVVFANPRDPLASRRPLRLRDLAKAQWILREKGSGTREIFEKAFLKKNSTLNIRVEFGQTEAIKQAVQSGMGISCLSRLALREKLENKTLVELPTPELDLQRNLLQITHKNKYRTRCIDEFIKFVH
ncbi:LysR family transcriptional regulator [Pontiellaceae bacterium B12219]|nr:LysR family transcriptional regulator [Pontiellaceae bacterium B12219]